MAKTRPLPDHFPYGPSSAERWLTCHQAVDLSRGLSSRSSNYANEGTTAHEAMAEWLLTGKRPEPPTLCSGCYRACVTPPCHHCGATVQHVDDEMLDNVAEIVKPIQRLVLVQQAQLDVEIKIASKLFADFGGTVDALVRYWCFDDGKVSHVWDYKHGRGYVVKPQGNPQTLAYLLLAREKFGRADTYRTTIVQPRAEGYDGPEAATAEYTNDDLDAFQERVQAAMDGNDLVAGDHCRWCPASAAGCPAIKELQEKVAAMDFGPATLDDELAWVLQNADVIKSSLSNAYDEALTRATAGRQIPGHKLVQGYGHRAWLGSDETIERKLKQRGMKKADIFNTTLKSPAQIEKAVDSDRRKTICDGITAKPLRGLKLVSNDKPGTPVEPGAPGTEFNDLID